MILPIYTFGAEVLRRPSKALDEASDELQKLIDDMFETMRNADGVGLAAPQIGRNERLFVIDLKGALEAQNGEADFPPEEAIPGPMVFINPSVEPLEGPEVEYEEGCLSIPELRENVIRPEAIEVAFLDQNLEPFRLQASGLLARVIQHEVDHLDGVLFIDRLSPLKRRLLKRRLREMSRGEVSADYPVLTAPEAARKG
jgi:peptide deformylase